MKNNYKISFTSNSLSIEDSVKVAELYIRYNSWDAVKSTILNDNILQRKKESTILRGFREIRQRLSKLTENQILLLAKGNLDTQKLLLLLAVSKTYQFIHDFIIEVIRNKYLSFDSIIYNSDYEKFYDSKAMVHDKLNNLKDSTKEKIKRVLFTILAQAGIINSVKEKIIIKPIFDNDLVKVIVEEEPSLLKLFLVSDTDIKSYIKRYG